MCTVSMVMDYYNDKWTLPANPINPFPSPNPLPYVNTPGNLGPSREEFDALKRDVLELKELVKRAKKYDEENGEKDCEMDEKVALIRKVARLVGVDMEDVLSKGAP